MFCFSARHRQAGSLAAYCAPCLLARPVSVSLSLCRCGAVLTTAQEASFAAFVEASGGRSCVYSEEYSAAHATADGQRLHVSPKTVRTCAASHTHPLSAGKDPRGMARLTLMAVACGPDGCLWSCRSS